MIVTTSQKVNASVIEKAKYISRQLDIELVPRMDRSVQALFKQYGNELLVATKEHIKWYLEENKQPFFFHPGLSVVRIKRMTSGDNDIMIQACGLKKGDSFLDCTLGLAADAIVASYVVGKDGHVVGLESQPLIAFLVAMGLKEVHQFAVLDEASRRIKVLTGDHETLLRLIPDQSFDVVYFDPMFRNGLSESSAMGSLRPFANPSPLSEKVIAQAKRVAKRRVVMKEHKNSGEFERLGFIVQKRRNIDIAYGVIET